MKTRLFVLMAVLAAAPAVCGGEADLFTGEVAIQNQRPDQRAAAFPLALRNVLQKLSGLRTFEDYPQVEPALRDAASKVVSFHYRNDEIVLPDGSVNDQLRLVVRFSQPAVLQTMQETRLPFWPTQRKSVEAWFVVDDDLGRRIMPLEHGYARQTLDEAATARGLDLSWPRPDEDGMYPVDMQLLWGGYTEDLGGHAGHGILIAAARREGAAWNVRTNLSYNGEHWAWRLRGVSLQGLLAESMHQAVDHIAAANAIAPSDRGAWSRDLKVVGLQHPRDYREVLGYLQDLSMVDEVEPVSATPGSVLFRLELSALPRYIDEAIAAGQTLEFVPTENSYRYLR